MAKLILLCTFALCAIAAARVIREAPQPKDETKPFTEIKDFMDSSYTLIEKNLLQLFQVENKEELGKKAQDEAATFATNLDKWATKIKQDADTLKDTDSVKELRGSIDKTIGEIQAKYPKTAEEFKNFLEQASINSQGIIEKVKGLSTSETGKEIQEFSKKFVDETSKVFGDITKTVEEAIKQ